MPFSPLLLRKFQGFWEHCAQKLGQRPNVSLLYHSITHTNPQEILGHSPPFLSDSRYMHLECPWNVRGGSGTHHSTLD